MSTQKTRFAHNCNKELCLTVHADGNNEYWKWSTKLNVSAILLVCMSIQRILECDQNAIVSVNQNLSTNPASNTGYFKQIDIERYRSFSTEVVHILQN